ncbi:uncharacterized protein LOC135485270 [Lineus longissimus]|uniref:uncharacterized protein LOC135485270 n=1 Tax=Lineus longissimus TaxID=88925 RepID=UPI002B4C40F0
MNRARGASVISRFFSNIHHNPARSVHILNSNNVLNSCGLGRTGRIGAATPLQQWVRLMSIISSNFPDTKLSDITLPQYVMGDFDKYGDLVALVDGPSGRSYKFSQIPQLVKNVGSAFTRLGLKKGDVVCLYLPNLPEYPITLLGVTNIGGIATTANPAYTADELLYQLRDSTAKYLVTVGPILEAAKAAAEEYGKLEDIYVIGGGGEGCKDFADLMKDDGSAFPHDMEVDIDDVAVLPYSSGTTGLPKGVELTHRNLVQNMQMANAERELIYSSTEDTSISVLPFFHIYGMMPVMSLLLRNGTKLVTMPKFDPEEYLSLIQQYKASFLCIVPPIALFLAKHPVVEKFDLSSVRDVICAAAPLSEAMEAALVQRIGKIVRQGYGLTETSPVSHLCPLDHKGKTGSIGLLLPNSKAKIVDVETREELGLNQDGELVLAGPHIMKGYHGNQEATDHCIKDGWFFTGDIGHVDADGYFYVVDRLKELIKYKGFQVPPAELEGLLLTHPSIADAAVIGVADESAGELPKAFVVLKPNSDTTEEDIVKFVEERVAYYKQLRGGVEFLTDIPKAASGKILRRILRARSS